MQRLVEKVGPDNLKCWSCGRKAGWPRVLRELAQNLSLSDADVVRLPGKAGCMTKMLSGKQCGEPLLASKSVDKLVVELLAMHDDLGHTIGHAHRSTIRFGSRDVGASGPHASHSSLVSLSPSSSSNCAKSRTCTGWKRCSPCSARRKSGVRRSTQAALFIRIDSSAVSP